jgi:3',5'-cyclic AMP phosphodiesterase CpdA
MTMPADPPRLLAISDLHVSYDENRAALDGVQPQAPGDWLLVVGDVAEKVADIDWALRALARRFAVVAWVPGNHDLWTHPRDPVQLRGEERYRHLVDLCRSAGVLTPEDPYPVFEGGAGPVIIAPLFLLYDYTFRPAGAATREEGLAMAYQAGIVGTDEKYLHPDPYPSREAWCQARAQASAERLARRDGGLPTVLVNHWPLTREPTAILRYPQYAQWCGTTATADWHRRFDAVAVVYGHLHIPRTTWQDGVRFEEVSVGYPREWKLRVPPVPAGPRQILPAPEKIVTRPGGFRW